jgi:hypothetical protein
MHLNLRLFLALLLTAGAVAAQDKVDPNDLSWVEKRAAEWAPRPSERKFDQIAWVTEARTAVELGKKHNRPLFIFTHDGRMARGRC